MPPVEASPIAPARPLPADPPAFSAEWPDAETTLAALPVTDWTLRPFLATRRSPLWVGAALAVAVWMASCAYRMLLGFEGRPGAWLLTDPYFWLEGLNAIVLAYIPTALVYLRRGRMRDLVELRPRLDVDDASFVRLAQETLCLPPTRLAAAGALGALLLGPLPALDPGFWEASFRPPLDHPLMWLFVARMALTGWLAGHAFATEMAAARGLSRLGATHLRVDLLDIRSLAPFARASQRGALSWVVVSSLVSLFWLGPATGISNVLIIVAILTLVTGSFFVSIHGAHRGIVRAKRAALARIEAQIRLRGTDLEGSRTPPQGPAMADLVAYHTLLERTREWPVGAPAVLRGAFIAALALGSWLGGALMDQLIERVLG